MIIVIFLLYNNRMPKYQHRPSLVTSDTDKQALNYYNSGCKKMVLCELASASKDLVGHRPLLGVFETIAIVKVACSTKKPGLSQGDDGVLASRDCLLANPNTREYILAARHAACVR